MLARQRGVWLSTSLCIRGPAAAMCSCWLVGRPGRTWPFVHLLPHRSTARSSLQLFRLFVQWRLVRSAAVVWRMSALGADRSHQQYRCPLVQSRRVTPLARTRVATDYSYHKSCTVQRAVPGLPGHSALAAVRAHRLCCSSVCRAAAAAPRKLLTPRHSLDCSLTAYGRLAIEQHDHRLSADPRLPYLRSSCRVTAAARLVCAAASSLQVRALHRPAAVCHRQQGRAASRQHSATIRPLMTWRWQQLRGLGGARTRAQTPRRHNRHIRELAAVDRLQQLTHRPTQISHFDQRHVIPSKQMHSFRGGQRPAEHAGGRG